MSSRLSTGLWVESGTLRPPHLSLDPAGLSSDSGLGGSSDGSSDVLAFGAGSVVDSVTEDEGAESEESSGEADGEAEAWGLADVRELHPGLLAHRAARTRDLPALATALAHGAEVNWADAEDEGKTPLVQAVLGVSGGRGGGVLHGTQVHLPSSLSYGANTGTPGTLLEASKGPFPS